MLEAAFRSQARSCAELGSPFMARLMAMLADRLAPDHGDVAARLHAWPGDVSSSGASLPLRLAGGLHALALRGHEGLQGCYPPREGPDWGAVSATLHGEAAFLLDWIASPPQTNEIGRAAVLRAAGQWIAARHGLPLDWRELGASAGLNLHLDRYALVAGGRRAGPPDAAVVLAPDWAGPPPPDAEPAIATRRGVDVSPLSPLRDASRLRAYAWPDQPDRIARLDAALALPPAPVDRMDAADWLEAMAPQAEGTARVICHTIAWQYFPESTARRARAAIEAMGAAATARAPVAWFGMEADGGRGAGLALRLWPGDERLDAGRADFHGRWVEWRLA